MGIVVMIDEVKDLKDEQIAEFKEAFSLFGEGQNEINSGKLGDLMRSLGQNPTNAEVKELKLKYLGNSMLISFPKFLTIMAKQMQRENPEKFEKAFAFFKTDEKDTIKEDMFYHVLTTLGEKMKSSEVRDVLEDAPKNEDGEIKHSAFLEYLINS